MHQIKHFLRFASLAALVMGIGSCQKEKDDRLPNQTPETTVSLRTITLADANFLVSSVDIAWSGTDADGFVKAYELSTDGQNWSAPITRTDSLIRFSFTNSEPTQTIILRVRAVDNQDARDDTPAELELPIRNQPPVANFTASLLPYNDTVLFALTLPIAVSDPDGIETLDSILIRCNQGPWVLIPNGTNLLTFLAENPSMNGAQPARIYRNLNAQLLPTRLEGFVVGGNNTFEIRATDIARSRSQIGRIITSTGTDQNFYVRRKTSDLLVIDSHTGTIPRPEATYFPILAQVAPQYDYVDFNYRKGFNQPRFFRTNMPLVLSLYPRVFWYMNDVAGSAGNRFDTSRIILETAAPLLGNYLEQGGKLLLSAKLPGGAGRILPDAPSFAIIPADSLYQGNQLIGIRSRAPFPSLANDLPNLVYVPGSVVRTENAIVFKESSSVKAIYELDSSRLSGISNYRTVGVRRFDQTTGKPNFYFFSIDLNLMSGDIAALQQFFDKVINQDFR